jgi:hypothetical protein
VELIHFVREAGISKAIRTIVICPTMVYGVGRGMPTDSDQLPKLGALSKQLGAGIYFGKGLNRYSNVLHRRSRRSYVLALDKAPGGSFFFAENETCTQLYCVVEVEASKPSREIVTTI